MPADALPNFTCLASAPLPPDEHAPCTGPSAAICQHSAADAQGAIPKPPGCLTPEPNRALSPGAGQPLAAGLPLLRDVTGFTGFTGQAPTEAPAAPGVSGGELSSQDKLLTGLSHTIPAVLSSQDSRPGILCSERSRKEQVPGVLSSGSQSRGFPQQQASWTPEPQAIDPPIPAPPAPRPFQESASPDELQHQTSAQASGLLSGLNRTASAIAEKRLIKGMTAIWQENFGGMGDTSLDADETPQVSLMEFRKLFHAIFPNRPMDDKAWRETKQMFEDIDADRSGLVDIQEILSYLDTERQEAVRIAKLRPRTWRHWLWACVGSDITIDAALNHTSDKPARLLIGVFKILSQCMIIMSIVVIIVDSLPERQRLEPDGTYDGGNDATNAIEIMCNIFFTTELVAYTISWPGSAKAYFLSFETWIDILSILPFYVDIALSGNTDTGELAGFVALRSLRTMRVLRVFRLLRSLKMAGQISGGRMTNMPSLIKGCLRAYQSIVILFMLKSISTVIAGAFILIAERQDTSFDVASGKWVRHNNTDVYIDAGRPIMFQSYRDSLWWAVGTISAHSYGDVYPVTNWGKFIAAAAMYASILILAYPIAILQSVFNAMAEEESHEEWRKELKTAWYMGLTEYVRNVLGDLCLASYMEAPGELHPSMLTGNAAAAAAVAIGADPGRRASGNRASDSRMAQFGQGGVEVNATQNTIPVDSTHQLTPERQEGGMLTGHTSGSGPYAAMGGLLTDQSSTRRSVEHAHPGVPRACSRRRSPPQAEHRQSDVPAGCHKSSLVKFDVLDLRNEDSRKPKRTSFPRQPTSETTPDRPAFPRAGTDDMWGGPPESVRFAPWGGSPGFAGAFASPQHPRDLFSTMRRGQSSKALAATRRGRRDSGGTTRSTDRDPRRRVPMGYLHLDQTPTLAEARDDILASVAQLHVQMHAQEQQLARLAATQSDMAACLSALAARPHVRQGRTLETATAPRGSVNDSRERSGQRGRPVRPPGVHALQAGSVAEPASTAGQAPVPIQSVATPTSTSGQPNTNTSASAGPVLSATPAPAHPTTRNPAPPPEALSLAPPPSGLSAASTDPVSPASALTTQHAAALLACAHRPTSAAPPVASAVQCPIPSAPSTPYTTETSS